MTTEPETPKLTITRNTAVTLGVVIGVLGPILGSAFWVNQKLDQIDRRLERIEISNSVVMSKSSFESWALRLARDNPTVRVPEFHQ